jgi:LuxR family transcriptional regulator, quorum-sensing system regulator SinR
MVGLQLHDWLANTANEDGTHDRHGPVLALFDLIRRRFPVGNCLFVDVAFARERTTLHRLHHTFSPDWETAYINDGHFRRDPVLRLLRKGAWRVDWRQAHSALPGPASARFLAEAKRNGVSCDGLTFVLRREGDRLVLLGCEALPSVDWPDARETVADDLFCLGRLLATMPGPHDGSDVLSPPSPIRLTPREREVLKWTAAGKSYWEIATILGISERTVRHFMTNAREKLGAVTNSQAVARALIQRHLLIG